MESDRALKVSYVHPDQLSENDLTLLQKSVELDPYGVPLERICGMARERNVTIFRVEEPFKALVVVQIVTMVHGKTLFILHLAGRGVVKYRKLLFDFLQEIAAVNAAEYIACGTIRKGAMRLYDGLDFAPIMVLYGRKL